MTGAGAASVLLVDVDGFRNLTDQLGPELGTALLGLVRHRLAAAAPAPDAVTHAGGDRFAVHLAGAGAAAAAALAGELLAGLAAPFDVDGRPVEITASIGTASAPPNPPEHLAVLAEVALGDAKARGGARVARCADDVAGVLTDDAALGAELTAALARDALTLRYQPVVDVTTGHLVAVEAFVRWTDPRLGEVPAERFVAVAGAVGAGTALDRWAVDRACRDQAALRAAAGGRAVRVAVNVSVASIADPAFGGAVVAALARHGVPGDALSVEVTESAILREPGAAAALLDRLRDHGVTAAIDDFGTGYSSLGSLRRLAVTALKVDRSFVAAMTADRSALAVTASIVEVSRTMGLTPVAEGVETVEQLDVLRSLGCAWAQGFLWSPAVDPESLAALVAALPRGTFDVRYGADWPRTRPPRSPVTTEHGLHELVRLHRLGASPATIAAALNADGYRTPRGLRWHHATVAEVIAAYDARPAGDPHAE